MRGLASALLLSALAAAPASGGAPPPAEDYALQCRGCHAPDGAGVPGRVPALDGVGALLATPAGRARLVAVPGVRQASLSDARLAALLAWVGAEFAPPGSPAFAPLSPAEVARLRAAAPR
jgi:mono/diheme cytochrome c family protein